MLLYKYLPPERIDVIRDGRIRFTPPDGLNDLFECSPVLDLSDTAEALRQNLHDMLDAKVAEVREQSDLSDEEEEELRQLVDSRDSLVNRLANPETLSRRSAEDVRSMISQNIGVLSLSKVPNSSSMWDRYAGGHAGFLLGLDSESEFFHTPDAAGRRSEPLIVDYVDEPPIVKLALIQDLAGPAYYQEFLATKLREWEHEKEVRITRVLHEGSDYIGRDPKGLPINLFYIEMTAIRSVVLGAFATDGLAGQIERALERDGLEHVQIQRARVNRSANRIDIVPHVRDWPSPR